MKQWFSGVLQQLKDVSASRMANTLAWGFLAGFGYQAGLMLLGAHFDLGVTLLNFTHPDWLYNFIDNSFNSGVIATWGLATKSAYDKHMEAKLKTQINNYENKLNLKP